MSDSELFALIYDCFDCLFWVAFFIAFGVVAGTRFGNWLLESIKEIPSDIKEIISDIKSRKRPKN